MIYCALKRNRSRSAAPSHQEGARVP